MSTLAIIAIIWGILSLTIFVLAKKDEFLDTLFMSLIAPFGIIFVICLLPFLALVFLLTLICPAPKYKIDGREVTRSKI